MTRSELCALLCLESDASIHQIRSRVARVATGKPEMGSSPAKRAALFTALRLAPGCSDLAILRVCESLLRPHPLAHRYRGDVHTMIVDARGAKTI